MLFKSKKNNEFIEFSFEAFGTINYIKIFNQDKEFLFKEVLKKAQEIENLMSVFIRESDIYKINDNAGKMQTIVCKDTIEVLKRSIYFSDISEGLFDVTIRPLVELWGIGKKDNFIPENEEILRLNTYVNYKDILIDESNREVMLRRQGQSIDLGSIAKGYAADCIKNILVQNEIKSAIINLGGNIVVIGKNPEKKEWKVGIQNPVESTGVDLGYVNVMDKTIVTSGINERFFIKDNERFHHLLNPKTGYPIKSNLLSVTVISDISMDADALSTILFSIGYEKSMSIVNKFNINAIFVTDKLEIIITEGIVEKFYNN